MYSVLIILFILVAILLVFVILIQSGKGGGLAGTFGGGDSMGSVFGGRGSAPFLTRITSILAGLFMFIALLLGMITQGSVDNRGLVERERERRMASPARTLPEVAEPAGQEALPAPATTPENQ